jgi:hypothetical protein
VAPAAAKRTSRRHKTGTVVETARIVCRRLRKRGCNAVVRRWGGRLVWRVCFCGVPASQPRRPEFGASAAGPRGVAAVAAGAAGYGSGAGRDDCAHGGPGTRTAMRAILAVSTNGARFVRCVRAAGATSASSRGQAGVGCRHGRQLLTPAPQWSRYSLKAGVECTRKSRSATQVPIRGICPDRTGVRRGWCARVAAHRPDRRPSSPPVRRRVDDPIGWPPR